MCSSDRANPADGSSKAARGHHLGECGRMQPPGVVAGRSWPATTRVGLPRGTPYNIAQLLSRRQKGTPGKTPSSKPLRAVLTWVFSCVSDAPFLSRCPPLNSPGPPVGTPRLPIPTRTTPAGRRGLLAFPGWSGYSVLGSAQNGHHSLNCSADSTTHVRSPPAVQL